MSRVGVTGRRPEYLPWGDNEKDIRAIKFKNRLKYSLSNLIEQGYNEFFIGMARGIDTYIAEILLDFIRDGIYNNIVLNAVIPYPDFMGMWNNLDKLRAESIMSYFDNIITVSSEYNSRANFLRNKYIVDNSDVLFAVFDGEERGGTYNTIEYAKKKRINIITERIY